MGNCRLRRGVGGARQVQSGDITKRHRWPDGHPRPRVGAAHDARCINANGIQARQRLALLIDDLGLGVGSNAGEGTKSPGTTRTA